MEQRISFIGIVIENRQAAPEINQILSEHANIIIGRMGLPHQRNQKISIISLIVDATTDQLNSLTSQLNNVEYVTVKNAQT